MKSPDHRAQEGKTNSPHTQSVNVVNTTQIAMVCPVNANQGNPAALVLDPIIDGFHLTRVLMDGGSCLNLLYQDTVCKMGIDHSVIKPTKTTFSGIIPGVEACCTGSIALEVVFGSPENYRTEEVIFEIVPFRSDYQALLG